MNDCRRISRRVVLTSAALSLGAASRAKLLSLCGSFEPPFV
jgi:hypothetical protein